ncbi:hypothetical protein NQ315_012354 [Exocentrus adspersus]|uniref:Uncharacterized protein n=1 Tax=Exocentrus adspersus TaxID=1586481 RepID=A0AAV8V913_9CUCU|nr:hypothetical protein NQ315_012354 [Exocentrus adspersus]
MSLVHVLGVVCFISVIYSAEGACKGCVTIDEFSFEKVLPQFEVTLLKFDDAYPYGDKHNAFVNVASEIADNKNIIVGQVGIKYYGENDNVDFSKRFGVNSKEDLPALRLFVQGEDEPFVYAKGMPWTEDDIKTFIRGHTTIYLGLPGCLEAFDKLALKFVSSSDQKSIVKKAEKEAEKLKAEKDKDSAKAYIKYMNLVVERGASFVNQEITRLKNLLSKVSEKKKAEISHRINILMSFKAPGQKTEL